MPLIVRDATPADVPAIAALYADEVRDHVNTYEYDVPDEAVRRKILVDNPQRLFGF